MVELQLTEGERTLLVIALVQLLPHIKILDLDAMPPVITNDLLFKVIGAPVGGRAPVGSGR